MGEASESSSGRKRARQVSWWKKTVSTVKRNTGQAYVSRTTKQPVEACSIRPPCRDGCFNKVPRSVNEEVFKEFWETGNYDLQNAYLQKIIYLVSVKRNRETTKPDAPGTAHSGSLHCTV